MCTEKVSVLLVGMSGYGHSYLKEIFSGNHKDIYLTGVVDIDPTRSDYYHEIIERDIPIYHSLDSFYAEKQADLAIISTPIHLHKEQSCYAMHHGSHVLCEKPMTANPNDITEMINVRDKTGKFLAVGFNWSFTTSTQQLKKDILNGKFGKPKRMKSIVLWPRNDDYYGRSSWAGKAMGSHGQMIFDSVANNATAHYLHHLFYLMGDTTETSAEVDQVTAELYKANDIETFDTCAVQMKTKSNIDVLYIASHAVNDSRQPRIELEFEGATITYHPESGVNGFIAKMADGTIISYEDPDINPYEKISVCVKAIQQGNHDILCGIEAATPHVQAIYAMHQSVPNVPRFPSAITKRDDEQKLNWVAGLENILISCYEHWSLPSDLRVDWSVRGRMVGMNHQ